MEKAYPFKHTYTTYIITFSTHKVNICAQCRAGTPQLTGKNKKNVERYAKTW